MNRPGERADIRVRVNVKKSKEETGREDERGIKATRDGVIRKHFLKIVRQSTFSIKIPPLYRDLDGLYLSKRSRLFTLKGNYFLFFFSFFFFIGVANAAFRQSGVSSVIE